MEEYNSGLPTHPINFVGMSSHLHNQSCLIIGKRAAMTIMRAAAKALIQMFSIRINSFVIASPLVCDFPILCLDFQSSFLSNFWPQTTSNAKFRKVKLLSKIQY